MAISLGIFLGFVNVFVNAIALDLMSDDRLVSYDAVIAYGIVPGVMTGTVLGVVAGLSSGSHPWLRRAALTIPALGVVWWLATGFGLESMAVYSAIPTLVCCAILERRTRVTHGIDEDREVRPEVLSRSPVLLGVFLALIDVGVVAAIAHALNAQVVLFSLKGESISFAKLTLVFGSVPALLVGIFIGKLAGDSQGSSVVERRIALCGIPLLAIVVLSAIAGVDKAVLIPLLPTVCGSLWLESATRVSPPNGLPRAQLSASSARE